MTAKRHSVKVSILNEEYAIRSDTPPDHTRAVAQYVDRAIRQVMSSGLVADTNRAAILAALQIAGELFEARASTEELTSALRSLSEDIRPLVSSRRSTEADAG
jgi:cell division protein ZapA